MSTHVLGIDHMLAMEVLRDKSFLYDIFWIKVILLKVSLFAWRLLQNRLQTKDNLIRRGYI